MNTLTIPRKLAQKDDLIVVPRKEYEALLELKKFKEFMYIDEVEDIVCTFMRYGTTLPSFEIRLILLSM